MKKLLISLVTVALIAPQVALASWWNPISWNIWSIFKQSPKQTESVSTESSTNTLSEIEALKKEIDDLKSQRASLEETKAPAVDNSVAIKTQAQVPPTPKQKAVVAQEEKGVVVPTPAVALTTTPPMVKSSDLSVTLVNATSTTNAVYLSWSTNLPTDSKVFFKQTPTGKYETSEQVISSVSGYSTQHSVDIRGLTINTQYSYTIEATTKDIQDKKITGTIFTNGYAGPTISKVATTQSSPVAENVSQPLGSLSITSLVTNEPVLIKSMRFSVANNNLGTSRLEKVSLSGDGIEAGPTNQDASSNITFTNKTFGSMPGEKTSAGIVSTVYLYGTINGKSGDTVTISTNPSKDWVVKGGKTGEQANLPNTVVELVVRVK